MRTDAWPGREHFLQQSVATGRRARYHRGDFQRRQWPRRMRQRQSIHSRQPGNRGERPCFHAFQHRRRRYAVNENGADSTYWSSTNAPDQSSVLGYIPENVWNESCADPNVCGVASLFASSGGASTLYSKPSWQVGLGVPNDGERDLPDVSLDAAAGRDGYLVCQDGICATNASGQLINAELVGGTSAAAPTFAAILALIAQKTNSRQGQANFVLYPLAGAQNAANCGSTSPPQAQCIFKDITVGNNSVPGQTG